MVSEGRVSGANRGDKDGRSGGADDADWIPEEHGDHVLIGDDSGHQKEPQNARGDSSCAQGEVNPTEREGHSGNDDGDECYGHGESLRVDDEVSSLERCMFGEPVVLSVDSCHCFI